MRIAVLALVAALSFACSGNPTQPTPLAPSPPPSAALPPEQPPPVDPMPNPPLPPIPVPRLARSRFLIFGDSLTAGTTSPTLTLRLVGPGVPQSYPFKLHALLTGRYTGQTFSVENAGLTGEAAEDAVARFPRALADANSEVVVLMHGVNDISFLGLSGMSRVSGYVNTMAREARQRGKEVIICTYPPQRPGGYRAADPPIIMTRFNETLRDVARGEGAILLDFEAGVPVSLIGQDGLHPTESGYARMAQLLYETLRGRYEQP